MRRATSLLLLLLIVAACAGAPPTATPSESPEFLATDPPIVDAQAELERVMELRLDWGLRHDEEWIRQVTEAPDSVMSELGIPVTPQEAAELAKIAEEEPRTRLIIYGAREHDTFGGLWVNDPPFNVVMLFTRDLDRHRAAVAALAPNLRVDVRPARFSEAELRRVQAELADELIGSDGVEFLSAGVDVKDNVAVLEAKSNDPTLEQRLEERYGGRLRAEIYPLPGPWANAEAGAGWRLLAAGISRGLVEPYSVRVATDAAEWHSLWSETDPANPAPALDAESEIAVLFAHGIGSSCPELRLDNVLIDHQAALIWSLTSDPLAPRGCTADLAGAAYFVVAVQRDAVPDSPFTVRLSEELSEEIEVDLRP